MIQAMGTNIVIETRIGEDIGNVIWIVKGLESGMGEVVGRERGIGGTRMAEMGAGIGTRIAAGPVPLVDIVTGGPQEVQFAGVSAFIVAGILKKSSSPILVHSLRRCFGFKSQ